MKNIIAISCLILLASCGGEEEGKSGGLMIMHPHIAQPPTSAPVAAGYLEITNTSGKDDVLVSAEVDFAQMVQLHSMEMVDGIAKMRPVEGGIKIDSGETVTLKKGGLHIMFMKLKQDIKADETFKVKLNFEHAGMMEIDMPVKEMKAGDHSGH